MRKNQEVNRAEASLPPATAPAATDPLNLGFEERDGDTPRGWRIGIGAGQQLGNGYEIALDAAAHGGATSLRLRGVPNDPSKDFASAAWTIDAKPMRGKRVRLHGWVRTEDVSGGWVGLWVRADPEGMAFDNMMDRGVVGTTEWTEVFATIDVPAEAEQIVFGPLLVGSGTAWFDDLRFELSDPPSPHPIAIEGVVVDDTGAPIPKARVAMIERGEIAAHVVADAHGAFRFDATSGELGISANADGHVGAFVNAMDHQEDVRDLRLVLGSNGGVLVRGKTRGKVSFEEGAFIRVSRVSADDSDVFAVPLARDGRFAVRLPEASSYVAQVWGAALGMAELSRKGATAEGTVDVSPRSPAPPEVVSWIEKQGVALATAEPGQGLADIAPVGRMIGKARVIALGEATHGTREFFQLKHRFLEYLVAEQGFTVFAIEANQPECRALNEYVLHGNGDPEKGLDGIYFWNTEEVLAMIEWMRAWNADPTHTKKVQFTGFDMQEPAVAYTNVKAYLASVGEDAAALLAAVDKIAGSDAAVASVDAAVRKQVIADLAAIAKTFDAKRGVWTATSGAPAYDDARHDLRIVQQNVEEAERDAAAGGWSKARDEYMAENVLWILDHQPKGTRVVVWAHNGHVKHSNGMMGDVLRKKLGKDYLAFGFAFHEGAFQAFDGTGKRRGPREFSVGPALDGDLSEPFHRAAGAIYVADLRKPPKAVKTWLDSPHTMFSTGAMFSSERAMTSVVKVREDFDALIYVDKTTRARPVRHDK